MRNNRCPWCAKQIDRTKNRYRAFRTTPGSRYTRFERCQYCHHFYGQQLAETWIVLYILLAIMGILLLASLWKTLAYYVVFLLSGGTVAWICLRPFQRMDAHEKPIPFDMPVLKRTFTISSPSNATIQKNMLYFLTDDFDRQDSFCTVSPILVHAFDSRTGELTFSFLYAHPLNQDYLQQKQIALYHSNMSLAAELVKT